MNASVTLSLDSSPFAQGLDRAEKRAQGFGQRVESSFQGMFKRTPGRRAERALGGLLGDIATGNAAQGIAMFAGKLTGLGLAAGVGIGAAVELFSTLHQSITEVGKAQDDLDKQMSHPVNLTSIEGLGKAIDNLREKQGTFTHGLTGYLYDIAHQKGAQGLTDLGKSGLEEEKDISAAIAKRQDAERLRGRTELVRANVLSSLESDPQRKALAEMRFKFEDRRKELMASPDKGSRQRLEALDAEQNVAEKNFKLSKRTSDIKLDAEEKIQRLIGKGLSKDDEKKSRALTELEVLKAEIAGTPSGSAEGRRLKIAKTAKENEIRSFGQPTNPNENPFQFGTLSASDFERQQDTAKFNSNFASFGIPQQEQDKKGPAAPNAEVVTEVSKTNELLRQIFLSAK